MDRTMKRVNNQPAKSHHARSRLLVATTALVTVLAASLGTAGQGTDELRTIGSSTYLGGGSVSVTGHGYLDTALAAIQSGSATAPEYLAASAFSECIAQAIDPGMAADTRATTMPGQPAAGQTPPTATPPTSTPTNSTSPTSTRKMTIPTTDSGASTNPTTTGQSYFERLFPGLPHSSSTVVPSSPTANPRTGWSAEASKAGNAVRPGTTTAQVSSVTSSKTVDDPSTPEPALPGQLKVAAQGKAQGNMQGYAKGIAQVPVRSAAEDATRAPAQVHGATPRTPTTSPSATAPASYPTPVSQSELDKISERAVALINPVDVHAEQGDGSLAEQPSSTSTAVRSSEIIVADTALLAVRILLTNGAIVIGTLSPLPYAGVLDAVARPDVIDAVRTGVGNQVKLEGWDGAHRPTISVGIGMRVPVPVRAGLLDDALTAAIACDLSSDGSGRAVSQVVAADTAEPIRKTKPSSKKKTPAKDPMDDPLIQELLDWLAANPDA